MIISEEERNRILNLYQKNPLLKEETVEEELTDFIEVEELPVSDEGKYCVTDNLELKLIKTNQIVEGPPWWKFWKKKNKANNPTLKQKRKIHKKRLKNLGKRILGCKVVNR